MDMLFRNDKDKKDELASGVTRVPLLPLRDIIVFPHMVVPLFVGRQRSIKALEEATQKQGPIFLSSQKDAKTNEPTEEDIYKIGTLGTVVQMLKLPDGTVKVLIEGKKRAQVARFVNSPDFFLVEVEEAPEIVERNTEVEALTREVHSTFENYVKLKKKIPPEMVMSVSSIDDPGRFRSSKAVGAHFGLTPKKYQSGETDVTGRISKIGDGSVRTALYEAANVILTRPVKGSTLKSWGMRLAARAGMRQAKVALARKLAVVLHRMLADGTNFLAEKAAVGAAR